MPIVELTDVAKAEVAAAIAAAWHLALLRFTVTLDITDRLAVLMIAAEIDGLGPKQDSKPEFSFFSEYRCRAVRRSADSVARCQQPEQGFLT